MNRPSTPRNQTLVVGYGNILRGDDGAGLSAALALKTLNLNDTRILAVPQLTPEISWDMAEARKVIFIDAMSSGESEQASVSITRLHLDPAPHAAPLHTHHSSPRGLLHLCHNLFEQAPETWVIGIPGEQFHLAYEMSASTQQHVRDALAHVTDLVTSPPEEPSHA